MRKRAVSVYIWKCKTTAYYAVPTASFSICVHGKAKESAPIYHVQCGILILISLNPGLDLSRIVKTVHTLVLVTFLELFMKGGTT